MCGMKWCNKSPMLKRSVALPEERISATTTTTAKNIIGKVKGKVCNERSKASDIQGK